MKKNYLVYLILFCSITTLFSEGIKLPSKVSEYAIVLDKNELTPIPNDNFKIKTSYNVKGNFEIYGSIDTKEWVYLGNIDTKYVESKSLQTKSKIKKFRFFCVDYKEEKLEYEVLSKYDDIVVNVRKNEEILKINDKNIKKGFFILDYSDIDADDYFKLENTTSKSNFKISLYGFETKKEDWIYIGEGILKGYGDVDTIRSDKDVDDFTILALIAENEMAFTCKASERNSDLYIEIINSDISPESSTNDSDDMEEELKKLKNLYDKGYIDNEEYKLKKNQILGL